MSAKIKPSAFRPAWAKQLEAKGIRLSDRDLALVAIFRKHHRALERELRLRRIAELSFGKHHTSQDDVLQPALVRPRKTKGASRAARRS